MQAGYLSYDPQKCRAQILLQAMEVSTFERKQNGIKRGKESSLPPMRLAGSRPERANTIDFARVLQRGRKG